MYMCYYGHNTFYFACTCTCIIVHNNYYYFSKNPKFMSIKIFKKYLSIVNNIIVCKLHILINCHKYVKPVSSLKKPLHVRERDTVFIDSLQ